MKRLDFYVVQTISQMMLLAIVGLLGILMIFTFLEQVEDIRNNYRLFNVIKFVLFSAPRMFYETIPYAALIGCLAGLGLLANNSELIVMRAAGISTWSILLNAMKPTLVLILVGLYVGEFILPDIERVARSDRARALSAANEVAPTEGLWYREGDVFMHFDEVDQSGVLIGISHYEFDQNRRMTQTLQAARGVYHDVRKDEKYWLLEDVVITDLADTGTFTNRATSWRWNTELAPNLLETETQVEPNKMSIGELRAKIDYMSKQGLNSLKFQLGFWNKVLQPLATIGLVFVAISFIFGPLRESTMGVRVVTGLVIGILFKFVQDLLSPASLVFGFAPIIAVLIPILLCFIAGYFLLRRAK
jgi:lipopolysaccharide export system permease protein